MRKILINLNEMLSIQSQGSIEDIVESALLSQLINLKRLIKDVHGTFCDQTQLLCRGAELNQMVAEEKIWDKNT